MLLAFCYNAKNKGERPNFNVFLANSKMSQIDFNNALDYCAKQDWVEVKFYLTKEFSYRTITVKGIDIIEKVKIGAKKQYALIGLNFNIKAKIDSIIKGEAKLF